MLGQLAPQKPGEREALIEAGLDINRVLTERDLVSSDDVFFAATGITDGLLMQGVRYADSGSTTHSIVMRGKTRTRRMIQTEHGSNELKTVRLCHEI